MYITVHFYFFPKEDYLFISKGPEVQVGWDESGVDR